MDFVDVHHPETGGTARVPESAVAHMEPKGWKRVAEEPAEEPAKKKKEKVNDG